MFAYNGQGQLIAHMFVSMFAVMV